MQPLVIPPEIRREVLEPLGTLSVDPLPPGMSGASVFCCRLASGQLRILKRWPRGVSAHRLIEVAHVVRCAREHGCQLSPRVDLIGTNNESYRQVDDLCWQLMEWMPGQPLTIDCPLSQIESGAAAISAFHQSVAGLAVLRQPAPAVIARLHRAEELTTKLSQISTNGAMRATGGHRWLCERLVADALFQAHQLVVWKWPEVIARIRSSLASYSAQPVCTQWVLRDVHRENALFLEGQPSGLIDFDALRIDTPWTDLARWTGSFLGGPHQPSEIWDAALAGFSRHHSLEKSREMEFGRRFAKDLAFATNWIALANWLEWLVIEQRAFAASPEVIAERIDGLRRAAVTEI